MNQHDNKYIYSIEHARRGGCTTQLSADYHRDESMRKRFFKIRRTE